MEGSEQGRHGLTWVFAGFLWLKVENALWAVRAESGRVVRGPHGSPGNMTCFRKQVGGAEEMS